MQSKSKNIKLYFSPKIESPDLHGCNTNRKINFKKKIVKTLLFSKIDNKLAKV